MFARFCGVLITRFLSSLTGLFRFMRSNPAMNGWAILMDKRQHAALDAADQSAVDGGSYVGFLAGGWLRWGVGL